MTIERDGYQGPITIWCDAAGCSESIETHCEQFSGALAKAKGRGWKAVNVGTQFAPVWEHRCKDCVE